MLGKLHSAKLHDRSNDDDADSLLPISCAAQSMQTVLTSAHTQLNLFTAAHHAQDGQVKNWQRVTDFADEFQLFVQKIKEEQKSRPELIKMYMCFLELSSSIKFALHYAQHTHKMNPYPPLNTTATPFLQPCHPSDQQGTRFFSMESFNLHAVKLESDNPIGQEAGLRWRETADSPLQPRQSYIEQFINGPPVEIYQGPYEVNTDIQLILKSLKPMSDKKKYRPYENRQLICHSCGIKETPEWRKGPQGMRTLCNACGLQYAKRTRNIKRPDVSSGPEPITAPQETPAGFANIRLVQKRAHLFQKPHEHKMDFTVGPVDWVHPKEYTLPMRFQVNPAEFPDQGSHRPGYRHDIKRSIPDSIVQRGSH